VSDAIREEMIALLPRLRAFARSLARAPDRADDLVQATCMRALDRLDGFRPGTRLDAWLFRIMRNLWIDEHRARRPVLSLVEVPGAEDIAGSDGREAEERLTLAAVGEVVAAMPEELRSVLVLVCVEGLKYREAAEILDIPIGTVMSRLARARRTVAAALDGTEVDPRAGAAG
jgi:RNA polymerase sigma-70 factor, ECF subfamily